MCSWIQKSKIFVWKETVCHISASIDYRIICYHKLEKTALCLPCNHSNKPPPSTGPLFPAARLPPGQVRWAAGGLGRCPGGAEDPAREAAPRGEPPVPVQLPAQRPLRLPGLRAGAVSQEWPGLPQGILPIREEVCSILQWRNALIIGQPFCDKWQMLACIPSHPRISGSLNKYVINLAQKPLDYLFKKVISASCA